MPWFFTFADKNVTAPNFNLVNQGDLNRILQFEIFLYKDGQLCAAHVILEYKPISSSFQSPKNVIKAKNPRLHLIDIAILGFITGPPPEGTHRVELLNQHTVEEEVISLDSEQEEETIQVLEVVDLEEDFKVFD